MLKRKKLIFIASLMLVVLICCNSCTTAHYDYCPSYPVAGEAVAKELDGINYDQAPAFWEWLGRIDKLRQELDLCKIT